MKLHQWKDCDYRGRIERLDYTTTDRDGNRCAKYANVYVPYGYHEKEQYNVLYLLHGGGGNPDAWLDASQIKNLLDNEFYRGIKPFLVVFPTYYNLNPSEHRHEGIDAKWENENVLFFQEEFAHDLIPAVERKFHTYAENTDQDGLKASRSHRAVGGFSMGGAATWYAFLKNLDLAATFLPLSGDCWAIEPKGGNSRTAETAALLAEHVRESGYGKEDFRIFIGTGSRDIAYENLVPQVEEMKKHSDVFLFSENPREGNLHFTVREGAYHAYEEVFHHICNDMNVLFQ